MPILFSVPYATFIFQSKVRHFFYVFSVPFFLRRHTQTDLVRLLMITDPYNGLLADTQTDTGRLSFKGVEMGWVASEMAPLLRCAPGDIAYSHARFSVPFFLRRHRQTDRPGRLNFK